MNDARKRKRGRAARILKRASLSTSGIVVLTLLLVTTWGVVVEPRFLLDVREETAEVRNLPDSWIGERIALLADLQVGMWLDNDGMVKKAVHEAIEFDPAAVLIAGDFIFGDDPNRINRAIDLLRPLADAEVPVYAVFGNHDHSMMKHDSEQLADVARQLQAALEEMGVVVLDNAARPMAPRTADGAPLYVVGIGSVWAGKSRPLDAFADLGSDEPRVVLMHNPVAFRELPPHSASLTLAAHTHGGQLRIPFTRSNCWLDIAKEREVIGDGWGEQGIGDQGNRIYVNRGIGFSTIPARFLCRPELTVFTLQRASGNLPERGPEGNLSRLSPAH